MRRYVLGLVSTIALAAAAPASAQWTHPKKVERQVAKAAAKAAAQAAAQVAGAAAGVAAAAANAMLNAASALVHTPVIAVTPTVLVAPAPVVIPVPALAPVVIEVAGPQPIDEASFAGILAALQAETFENNKLRILETAMHTRHLLVSHLERFLPLFSFENNKVRIVEMMAPRVLDRHEAHRLPVLFSFNNSKARILEVLR